jgi:iron complex transport system substrate-binding protein
MSTLKCISFLPAATSMIYQMGLQEFLYGVTFECPSDKPKVIRSHLEGTDYSSSEIEQIVSDSKKMGKDLYYVDEELLHKISPDIIFTQDVCDVCQVASSFTHRAIYSLQKQPKVISLTPRCLTDIYDNAITIARALGREEDAYRLLAKLQRRTDDLIEKLREHRAPLKRVMVMEWLDPVYNCGHWIPYQVAQAGGVDMLSNPSGYSVITSWEKVVRYDPQVLVIAPCGFTADRAVAELDRLTARDGWNELTAVRENSVYLADADLFTCPSLHVVDGIALLAAIFHPDLFAVPRHLQKKYVQYDLLHHGR